MSLQQCYLIYLGVHVHLLVYTEIEEDQINDQKEYLIYPGVLASNGSLDNNIEMAGISLLTFSL